MVLMLGIIFLYVMVLYFCCAHFLNLNIVEIVIKIVKDPSELYR